MTINEKKPLAGLRILVAEDELMIAMSLEDMLDELGAEIVGPVNCIGKALRAIDGERPDAATLDVNLQGRVTYGIADELSARSIPFIFISGYGELPNCPAHLRDVPRLKKPFRSSDIAAALTAAFARAKSDESRTKS